jgi:hypothetical protein
MPRRSILSATERESLLALPDNRDDLIRRYTLSESDLSLVRQRRGAANRLGFAVQLCYLRYPGIVLGVHRLPQPALLHLVAAQLKVPVECWADYGERAQTRREHLVELQTVFGFESFTRGHHRLAVQELMETAMQTDKGVVLATALVEMLRARAILSVRKFPFLELSPGSSPTLPCSSLSSRRSRAARVMPTGLSSSRLLRNAGDAAQPSSSPSWTASPATCISSLD